MEEPTPEMYAEAENGDAPGATFDPMPVEYASLRQLYSTCCPPNCWFCHACTPNATQENRGAFAQIESHFHANKWDMDLWPLAAYITSLQTTLIYMPRIQAHENVEKLTIEQTFIHFHNLFDEAVQFRKMLMENELMKQATLQHLTMEEDGKTIPNFPSFNMVQKINKETQLLLQKRRILRASEDTREPLLKKVRGMIQTEEPAAEQRDGPVRYETEGLD